MPDQRGQQQGAGEQQQGDRAETDQPEGEGQQRRPLGHTVDPRTGQPMEGGTGEDAAPAGGGGDGGGDPAQRERERQERERQQQAKR